MNNPYQKQYMLAKYDDATKKKAIILPHSFDASLYDREIEQKERKKMPPGGYHAQMPGNSRQPAEETI